jgi:chitin synthase
VADFIFQGTDLTDPLWFTKYFLPKMQGFYKGPLVWDWNRIGNQVNNNGRFVESFFSGVFMLTLHRIMAVYNNRIYDLSDYIQTLSDNNGGGGYDYLDKNVVDVFKQQPGQDITQAVDSVFSNLSDHSVAAHKACLNNRFMYGQTDFRLTPRCTVQGYMLIVASALIALTILVKCKRLLLVVNKD